MSTREQNTKKMREWRARLSPEKKAAHLAKRRATRKPSTPLQQARAQIATLEWRARQAEIGGCTHCKRPATHGLRCEFHWFAMYVHAHQLGPAKTWIPILKEMWEAQHGRCAITGLMMSIGGGGSSRGPTVASLDHKIALANGGTNSKENLHWVRFGVNAAKADMAMDAFIDMCRDVVRFADEKIVPLRKV